MFGDLTTGAESDIQQLTQIARHMVGRWGMSRAIGPIAVLPRDGMGPLLPGASETSEATQRLVDEEVRRIVESAHTEVSDLLRSHRENLDSLVAGAARARDARRGRRVRGRRAAPQLSWRGPSRSRRRSLSHLQRLASGEPRVGRVPVTDLFLVEQPTQVDLLTVAQRGEVDQAPVDVA